LKKWSPPRSDKLISSGDLSLALNKMRPSKTIKFDKNIKISAIISKAGERPASKND